MKLFKKFFAGASALMLMSGAAFGLTNVSAQDVTTVEMYQVGSAPDNLDQLLGVVNEKLESELGLNLNITYIGWGEYSQKMTVMTNSGEKYDIAYAVNYTDNAQKGAYADLTDLMNEYASETLEYLDQSYIDGNTIGGKLYAFPVNGNVFATQNWAFNSTFLDKYDLSVEGIESIADLEPLLQTIKDNEPNVAPLAAGKGWRVGHDFDFVLDESVPLGIDMLGDQTKIVNMYEESDSLIEELKVMHDFYNKGLLPADAATSEQGYEHNSDTWFVRRETVGPRDFGNYLLSTVAGKPIELAQHTEIPLKSVAQAQMANFVVAQNSDHKAEAVQVLNAINTDPEILNTLVYGIEGENWEKNEDGTIKLLPAYSETNTKMSAWNTGNADILYLDENITDEQIEAAEQGLEEATTSPLLGFVFDTSSVINEVTNVKNVLAQYISNLHTGTVNPEQVLPEFNEQLKQAGLETIQEEMQRQFDEFRANQE